MQKLSELSAVITSSLNSQDSEIYRFAT